MELKIVDRFDFPFQKRVAMDAEIKKAIVEIAAKKYPEHKLIALHSYRFVGNAYLAGIHCSVSQSPNFINVEISQKEMNGWLGWTW